MKPMVPPSAAVPASPNVPSLITATAHTLPEQVDALARARAFAVPLITDELLDSGEGKLAHADAVAAQGAELLLAGAPQLLPLKAHAAMRSGSMR